MGKVILTIVSIMCTCLSVLPLQPTAAGIWRDDFEDRNTPEWEIYNLDRQAEKWWVADGEAIGEIFLPGFMSLWLTGKLTWRYYSVSCHAKLVVEKNAPPSIGLTLHDRGEEGTRYLFLINYVFGSVNIVKSVPDAPFLRSYLFNAEIDKWYQLTAAVHQDGTLEFWVDDQVFVTIDRDPLKGGQAGLVVSNAQAHFDDVAIGGANIDHGGPGKARPVALKTQLATTWGDLKIGASGARFR